MGAENQLKDERGRITEKAIIIYKKETQYILPFNTTKNNTRVVSIIFSALTINRASETSTIPYNKSRDSLLYLDYHSKKGRKGI